MPPPLTGMREAYIDVIEVDGPYQRQGIARQLLALTESWASSQGFTQIRAWSSHDKTEAIMMWHALRYCVCPARVWFGEPVDGFFAVKQLRVGER
jgi:GNAT superfamily N-acetyltransferase